MSGEEMDEYASPGSRSLLFPAGNEVRPNNNYYDVPDYHHSAAMRYDALPPGGGPPGSDPDFSLQQLIREAGVDIGILQPLTPHDRLIEVEVARKELINKWLAGFWLDRNNVHGRWRGSISVTHRDPIASAREIERWAGHPGMVEVLIGPETPLGFGDPWFNPIWNAASRHDLPVATHLMGLAPFEYTPIGPVGNQSSWLDFMASWSLIFASHLMSLVFDGAFDRFPNLRFVFLEGAFTWALPTLWRMDRMWAARKADLPLVKRAPSAYALEHVRFTTQPLEDPEDGKAYRRYLEWIDPALLLFATDYPHWSYDDPDWAVQRLPKASRARIMGANARELYRLPATVPALPGQLGADPQSG
jgi:predicted TIM-barrel fold metal-dependent hydrolase